MIKPLMAIKIFKKYLKDIWLNGIVYIARADRVLWYIYYFTHIRIIYIYIYTALTISEGAHARAIG